MIFNPSHLCELAEGKCYKIIEEGNHDKLVANENSYYSKLWKIQTGALFGKKN